MAEHPTRLTVVTRLRTRIIESHIPELDPAAAAPTVRKRTRIRRLREGRPSVQYIEQPRHRRGPALEQIDDPSQGDQGPGQHAEVEPKRDERSDADRSTNRQRAPDPEHRDHADPREKHERRMHRAIQPREAHVLHEVFVVHRVEPTNLCRLLTIRPNDPYPGEVFLRERRQVTEVLLHRLEALVNAFAHPDGDDGQEQHRQDGDCR